MNTFKIKSLTDVITNSSTEVFTIYNKGAINKVKEMVNSILALSDDTSNLTFDDLFEIDYCLNNYKKEELIINLVEKLKERGLKEQAEDIKATVTTEEELWEYSKQNNIYDTVIKIIEKFDDGYNDYRIVDGIRIKAKNNPNVDKAKLDKAVEMLNNIDHIFEQYACYC